MYNDDGLMVSDLVLSVSEVKRYQTKANKNTRDTHTKTIQGPKFTDRGKQWINKIKHTINPFLILLLSNVVFADNEPFDIN